MSFKGEFSWFTSLRQGGKRAISFTLTCKNMLMPETFDCAILDPSGSEPTMIKRQLRLKPNESFTFNYDTCGWDWHQDDYFVILDKNDKIVKRWDLKLKVYDRGECPECHGSYRCVKCNGNGTIRNWDMHSIDTCRTCQGTGVCQRCYIPLRQGSALSAATYGNAQMPNPEATRQRRISALRTQIAELQAKIEHEDWEARMMQRKGTNIRLKIPYQSHLELKHRYTMQLLQLQNELNQLEAL